MIIPLLDGVDLHQAVVTADALHCQRATADSTCIGAAQTSSCGPKTTRAGSRKLYLEDGCDAHERSPIRIRGPGGQWDHPFAGEGFGGVV